MSLSLGEELDWLTVDHDDFKYELYERISTPKYHPSMAIIDQWEQESIERIRQTAIRARRTLIDILDQHTHKIKKTLDNLTPILREARDGIKSFNEYDIKQWAKILQELKRLPEILIRLNKKNSLEGLTIDLRHENTLTDDEIISYDLLSIIHHLPSIKLRDCHDVNTRLSSSSQLDTHIYAQIQRDQKNNIYYV